MNARIETSTWLHASRASPMPAFEHPPRSTTAIARAAATTIAFAGRRHLRPRAGCGRLTPASARLTPASARLTPASARSSGWAPTFRRSPTPSGIPVSHEPGLGCLQQEAADGQAPVEDVAEELLACQHPGQRHRMTGHDVEPPLRTVG